MSLLFVSLLGCANKFYNKAEGPTQKEESYIRCYSFNCDDAILSLNAKGEFVLTFGKYSSVVLIGEYTLEDSQLKLSTYSIENAFVFSISQTKTEEIVLSLDFSLSNYPHENIKLISKSEMIMFVGKELPV